MCIRDSIKIAKGSKEKNTSALDITCGAGYNITMKYIRIISLIITYVIMVPLLAVIMIPQAIAFWAADKDSDMSLWEHIKYGFRA